MDTPRPMPDIVVDVLDEIIAAFEKAEIEHKKNWPAICAEFETAFQVARQDRAAYTPRLNILEVFGLKAWELSHSRALAWFLREDEAHEQGSLFMECFLRQCGVPAPSCTGYTVQREKPDRIDVVAYKWGAFALFVENKVNHHEREEQLADLQTSLVKFCVDKHVPESHRLAVFLTDDGRKPATAHPGGLPGFLDRNLCCVRRLDLFQAFQAALETCAVKSDVLTIFLDAYVKGISSHSGSTL